MSRYLRIAVGDAELIAVQDSWALRDPASFFAGVPLSAWEPYRHWLTDEGLLVQNYGSFVIRSQGKTILVDTGLGELADPTALKQPPSLLRTLAEAGIDRQDIDVVLFTHLHWDHTGWNTMNGDGQLELTFPNAEYVVQQAEFDYWKSPGEKPANGPAFDRVLAPVIAAERLEVVGTDYRPTDEVFVVPTPGHTPGHVSFGLTSAGQSAYVSGDALHKPVQLTEPGWYPSFDMDPVESTRSRRMLLDRVEREQALLGAGHFAFPSMGHATRIDSRRTFRFVD